MARKIKKEWTDIYCDPGDHQEGRHPEFKKKDEPIIKSVPEDAPLNKLFIPLTPLRMYIAEMQTAGYKKLPLGHLIGELHRIYKEDQDD